MGFWSRFVERHTPTVRSNTHIKTGHITFFSDMPPRFVLFSLQFVEFCANLSVVLPAPR